jgi:hypothetical protein
MRETSDPGCRCAHPGYAALRDRVTGAPFLTLNEKREAVSYGPVAGGDWWE